MIVKRTDSIKEPFVEITIKSGINWVKELLCVKGLSRAAIG
jgi:hypothetical protein